MHSEDDITHYPEAPCEKCHRWSQQRNMAQCWGCGGWWHLRCGGIEHDSDHGFKGAWHCRACLRHLKRLGVRDVTLDQPLM